MTEQRECLSTQDIGQPVYASNVLQPVFALDVSQPVYASEVLQFITSTDVAQPIFYTEDCAPTVVGTSVPSNAVTWRGDPLTWRGIYITWR